MKMLVMEHDPTDRFILEKAVGSKYESTLFGSEPEALEYASSNFFDIALINVHLLNHWDGLQFLRDLKKCSSHSFTSIAMATELGERSVKMIMQAGFDAILSLPINDENLREVLKSSQTHL